MSAEKASRRLNGWVICGGVTLIASPFLPWARVAFLGDRDLFDFVPLTTASRVWAFAPIIIGGVGVLAALLRVPRLRAIALLCGVVAILIDLISLQILLASTLVLYGTVDVRFGPWVALLGGVLLIVGGIRERRRRGVIAGGEGASEDERAIAGVIREFLDTAAKAEFPARLWAGDVAKALALGENVSGSSPFANSVRGGSARVEELVVESIDEGSAEVTLGADTVTKIDHPIAGERHILRRYDGTVRLRREAGSWRISSLSQDSVDFASALFEPPVAEDMVDGVRVAAAARYSKRELLLNVFVRNESTEVAVLEEVATTRPVWRVLRDRDVLRKRPLVLRGGASWGISVFLSENLLQQPLSVTFRINRKDVTITLTPARMDLRRHIRPFVHPRVVLHVIVLIALLSLLVLGSRALGPLGLALFCAGLYDVGATAIGSLSATRSSAQVAYALVGVAEVTVGAFLLWHEHFDAVTIVISLLLIAPALWYQFRNFELWRTFEAETVRDAPA